MKPGTSNIEATDEESLLSLTDPAFGVPFDVHFEIEDEEGFIVGVVGAHKAVMALRSPVFKAMFYGPLAQTGELIRIKKTSMFAFKEMVRYMHDADLEKRPWAIGVRELFRMVDLAERYNLPGLSERLVGYARAYLFPRESLLEVARLAEEFRVYTQVSQALLINCAGFLTAILETPEDFNTITKEWSEKEGEDFGPAFRLLARVDQRHLVYVHEYDDHAMETISHFRHISFSVQPRHRLQQLKMLLEMLLEPLTIEVIRDFYDERSAHDILCHSLWVCQLKDVEKAALQGVPLTMDTLVEGGFTYAESLKLHLDVIKVLVTWPVGVMRKSYVDKIWETMLDEESETIAAAKAFTLNWFSGNPEIMDRDHLYEKLISAGDKVKALPEYNDACDVYM